MLILICFSNSVWFFLILSDSLWFSIWDHLGVIWALLIAIWCDLEPSGRIAPSNLQKCAHSRTEERDSLWFSLILSGCLFFFPPTLLFCPPVPPNSAFLFPRGPVWALCFFLPLNSAFFSPLCPASACFSPHSAFFSPYPAFLSPYSACLFLHSAFAFPQSFLVGTSPCCGIPASVWRALSFHVTTPPFSRDKKIYSLLNFLES